VNERPEGWYMDPANQRVHRYWDGNSWARTEPHVDRASDDQDRREGTPRVGSEQ
jgi:uncharacterized protein DUF2510